MVTLLHFESEAEAKAAAQVLRSLGASAVKLLAECVESQGVKRKILSNAANALEREGFIFIRGVKFYSDDEYSLLPSLAGEEALDALEAMKST